MITNQIIIKSSRTKEQNNLNNIFLIVCNISYQSIIIILWVDYTGDGIILSFLTIPKPVFCGVLWEKRYPKTLLIKKF